MITEVVFYQIKADYLAQYPNISGLIDRFAAAQPGFISRVVRQDHQDEALFLDVVEWQTLEEAQAAAQAFRQDAALAPFSGAFERIISFHHLHRFA